MIFYNIPGLIGVVLSALPAIAVLCCFSNPQTALELGAITWAASMAAFAVLYDRTPPAGEMQAGKIKARGRVAIFGERLLLAPFGFLLIFGAYALFGQFKPAPSFLFWLSLFALGVVAMVVSAVTEPYHRMPANRACPQCGKPLRSNKARQCLECGASWRRKREPRPAAAPKEPLTSRLPLLAGSGCVFIIPLLLIAGNVIFGPRSTAPSPVHAGPSAIAAPSANAAPKTAVPKSTPVVNSGNLADVVRMAGVWAGSTNNNGFKEVWTIANKAGGWSVVCRYFRGADEIGMFHSETCWLENGQLACTTAFDVAPLPGWFGCTWSLRLVDDNTIQADWRDRNGFTGGGRLARQ